MHSAAHFRGHTLAHAVGILIRRGHSEDPLSNVVDVYIRRLCSRIDDGYPTTLIHTLRGLGYRLEAQAGVVAI